MLLCQIYRSSKKGETYLYTAMGKSLDELPEELLKQFGKPEPAMSLQLDENRKLARADAAKVIQSIEEKGYYLQMPPTNFAQMPGQDALAKQMAEIDALNEMLPRGD